ncbi:CENP-B homolog protein 2-like protein [Tanacetum coccineum]
MTDEIRRALCKHNKDNPSLTQKQLQEWVHSNYGLQVSQATISNTVKRSLEYLSLAPERGDVKRHKPAKFPDLEKSLYEWILLYQEHVNMTGLVKTEKCELYSIIYILIRLILALLVSTARTERAFSMIKICKNRLRNKMEDEYLAGNLVIYIEKERVKGVYYQLTLVPMLITRTMQIAPSTHASPSEELRGCNVNSL